MNENTQNEMVSIHPLVEEEFHKVTSRLDQVADENRRLTAELQNTKKARETLGRQEVYIDDMPGKQIPFRYQINIPLVGGSSSPITGTFNVSKDGPFVCRRIYISVLITDAPSENLGAASQISYANMIGRYAPVSSRSQYLVDWFYGIFWRGWARPRLIPALVDEYLGPPVDFEWEYNDSGGKVVRQDKPISGDIMYRKDDDGYLMNNEVFPALSTVNFIVSPTRPVTIVVREQLFSPPTDFGPIDIEVQVTFDGFKILQPWVSWEL